MAGKMSVVREDATSAGASVSRGRTPRSRCAEPETLTTTYRIQFSERFVSFHSRMLYKFMEYYVRFSKP